MKIRKKSFNIILFAALLIIILFVGYFIYNYSAKNSNKVCIENKTCFYVEIADTPNEREKGLGGKEFLEKNKGMLFIFEEETFPGFWMKDMNFPIDIIWIDKNMKIINIEKSLEPCERGKECPVFYPKREVMYVLEINSGLSEMYDFRENDSISIWEI